LTWAVAVSTVFFTVSALSAMVFLLNLSRLGRI
jgi:hypothetical protein